MATISITVPNETTARLKPIFKRMLREGEAIDLENPTNAEILAKAKSFLIDSLRNITQKCERAANAYKPEPVEMS